MIPRVLKSENATLKTTPYCILVSSCVYAILLIILGFHTKLQTPCLWSCSCICPKCSPLPPLYCSKKSYAYLKTCSDSIFSTPDFLHWESIFFPSCPKQAMSIILMDLSPFQSTLSYSYLHNHLPGLQNLKIKKKMLYSICIPYSSSRVPSKIVRELMLK